MDGEINYSAMRKDQQIARHEQIKKNIAALDNRQKALKIKLNSAYGAL